MIRLPTSKRYYQSFPAFPKPPEPWKIGDGLKKSEMLTVACEAAGSTVEKILSRDNTRDTVVRRRHVMHLLRLRGYSMTKIGHMLGRDHATVIVGLTIYDHAMGINYDG